MKKIKTDQNLSQTRDRIIIGLEQECAIFSRILCTSMSDFDISSKMQERNHLRRGGIGHSLDCKLWKKIHT